MKYKLQSLYFLLFFVVSTYCIRDRDREEIDRSRNPTKYKIGGVLSNNVSEMYFRDTIQVRTWEKNFFLGCFLVLIFDFFFLQTLNFQTTYVPKGRTFYFTTFQIDRNPIRTALSVCKLLITDQVYAVVVSHPLTGDLSPAAVSYTSGFYHIPVIGISSRDSAFSDKVIEDLKRNLKHK